MINACDLIEWYEEQCVLAIRKGNLPIDVTVEEASEYMSYVYCSSKELQK